MRNLNPCRAAGLEKFAQTLVLEVKNHYLSVTCNLSGVNDTGPRRRGKTSYDNDGEEGFGVSFLRASPLKFTQKVLE
jgi:hypothetical protein